MSFEKPQSQKETLIDREKKQKLLNTEREEKIAEIKRLNEAVQTSQIESIRQEYGLGTTSEAKEWIEKRVVENEARILEIDTQNTSVSEREEKIAEIKRLNEAVQTSQIESIRQEYGLGTTSEAKEWIEKRVVENEARILEIDQALTKKASSEVTPTYVRREQTIEDIPKIIQPENTPTSNPTQPENTPTETETPETATKPQAPETDPATTQMEERRKKTKERIEKLRAIADIDKHLETLEKAKSEVSYMSADFIAYAREKMGASPDIFTSEASAYMWVEKMLATLPLKKKEIRTSFEDNRKNTSEADGSESYSREAFEENEKKIDGARKLATLKTFGFRADPADVMVAKFDYLSGKQTREKLLEQAHIEALKEDAERNPSPKGRSPIKNSTPQVTNDTFRPTRAPVMKPKKKSFWKSFFGLSR